MIKRIFFAIVRRAVCLGCCFVPLDSKKIVISSFYGRGYGGNPKYIVEEIRRQNLDYKIIWLIRSEKEVQSLPEGVTPCKDGSLKSIYELMTAKVWIDNSRKAFYYKRRKQYYIQTWHGDIGVKKIEKDAETKMDAKYIKIAKKDSRYTNVSISGNRWYTQTIKRAFWYDGEIMECGYPRRDILLQNQPELAQSIKEQLGIPMDSKVLFYAPTFRKHQQGDHPDLSCFDLDWDAVLKAMSDKFGGTWVGILRLHPSIACHAGKLNLPSSIRDVTYYPDMQELMLISDSMITDYSSSLFDFAITKKSGFLFATDFEEYQEDRNVYFDITKLPFPFSQSNEQLINDIRTFDEKAYASNLEEFYGKTIGVFDDGKASERIVERIKEVTRK
ncbi:MAG: glycerophosphotransferase [Ruminococcaceae bacterium]|nr:glycerophosphotransferase [Oscillospiraceae bacterium]